VKTVNELLSTIIAAKAALTRLAIEGDDKAARGLMSLAIHCNTDLAPLMRAPGPLLRAAMERIPSCPVNLPLNAKRREALVAEIHDMGFATKCELNMIGKFDADAPLSKAVAKIYMLCIRPVLKNPKHPGFTTFDGKPGPFHGWIEWRDTNARKFPQSLTRSNSRQWADLAEPLLKIFWGKAFERHPEFARCGKPAEILTRWRQAWHSMARPEPKKAKPAK
jgi:hypothetical protein